MTNASGVTPRVLLVEDDEDNRDMLTELLTALGCSVRAAATGAEALALMVEAPDAVIVDISLPDIPGFEVALQIRSLHGPSVRIFAATGYTQGEVVAEIAAAGFDEILTKPVAYDAWARVVSSLLRS